MSRRCRNIKPELWLNENLAEISIPARYLFPGLWCLADKDGRLEYRPRKIKAELFPYDDLDIISLIAELHGKKFISVYENEGSQYIQIKNFKKHQNPHPKEKSCGYPEPVNVCIYDGKEKKFNYTASPVGLPCPSDILIPDILIPDILIPDIVIPVETTKPKKESSRFTPPTIEEAREYFLHLKAFDEAEAFYHHHNAKGWKVSGRSMVNWKSAISTWIQNDFKGNQARHKAPKLELVTDHRRYL